MIRVQIVDDHRMFVEGLTKIINESGIAEVVRTAGSVRECWQMLSAGPAADVLLLDIHLPDGSGIELCAQINVRYPDLPVLALSSYSEYTIVHRMLHEGASGYILKNAMAEEVLQGIQTVAAGERFVCENVDLLLKKQEGKAVVLTPREREMLRLICEGFTSAEIAEKMFFSVESISTYRRNLLFKLDARNTAALVKLAIEKKLV